MRRQHFSITSLPVPTASQELIWALREAEVKDSILLEIGQNDPKNGGSYFRKRRPHKLKAGAGLEPLAHGPPSGDYHQAIAAADSTDSFAPTWRQATQQEPSSAAVLLPDQDIKDFYRNLRRSLPPLASNKRGRLDTTSLITTTTLPLIDRRRRRTKQGMLSSATINALLHNAVSSQYHQYHLNHSTVPEASHHKQPPPPNPSVTSSCNPRPTVYDAVNAALAILPKLRGAHQDEDLMRHAHMIAELQSTIKHQLTKNDTSYRAIQAASLKQYEVIIIKPPKHIDIKWWMLIMICLKRCLQAIEGDIVKKSKQLLSWKNSKKGIAKDHHLPSGQDHKAQKVITKERVALVL